MIPRVPLGSLLALSADGQIYRAYGHVIVARHGLVLLVPIALVDGGLSSIIDACPVPWEEVLAIIEEPPHAQRPLPDVVPGVFGALMLDLAPPPWDVDHIRCSSGAPRAVTRMSHPSGIRLAVVSSLLPDQ